MHISSPGATSASTITPCEVGPAQRLLALSLLVASAPVLLPLMGLTALSGPALFRATRVGRDGVPFTMLKLRTMRVNASGGAITAGRDPRVTWLGRWVRPTRLDELPQLWHVVRGEMALVGPRPEAPSIVEANATPLMRRWLAIRPGLTSPGTLLAVELERGLADDADYVARVLEPRMALDVAYEDGRTWRSDCAVAGRTLAALWRRVRG